MPKRRVLVGQFFHETHAFNPVPTLGRNIRVLRGPALLRKGEGTGTTLGGILSALRKLDWEAVPSLGFFIQPSGRIEHAFYEEVVGELIAIAERTAFDAIALELHGAMCTSSLMDADGDLLGRLRKAVGPDIPIGVGLDMHAHVTDAMLQAVDICTACKESPHTDFPECGERVVSLLAEVLEGRLHPVHAMAKAPMIHMDSGLTAQGPLAEIKARAEALQTLHAAIQDISLFQVYRFADYDEPKGQTALVLTNGDATCAAAVAEELARAFWTNRERFRDVLPSPSEALDTVARDQGRRPFALADTGDRVIAGAPGDSTVILAEAIRRGDTLKGACPVTDAAAVRAAHAAGIGAELSLAIGGHITPGFEPLLVKGVVAALGDGAFNITGPVFGGEAVCLGPTAVLLVDGRLSVLLTTEPCISHTPAAFESQGIAVKEQDFVVAKSGMHFQANFAGIATPLLVETPGLSHPAKGFFTWRNAQFWPERELENPLIEATVFDRAPLAALS